MFDSLINFQPEPSAVGDFVALENTTPSQILSAQQDTAKWLEEMGVPDDAALDSKIQRQAARDAFETLHFDPDAEKQRAALVSIKTPAAVQHLTGMLTAYDWEFIHQAKELRGYTVAKIVEETTHPDARIRLKALQMLGNVTEVALFTERVEVTKKDASEEEIERRLRERLARFILPEEGASVKEVAGMAEDEEINAVAETRGF